MQTVLHRSSNHVPKLDPKHFGENKQKNAVKAYLSYIPIRGEMNTHHRVDLGLPLVMDLPTAMENLVPASHFHPSPPPLTSWWSRMVLAFHPAQPRSPHKNSS